MQYFSNYIVLSLIGLVAIASAAPAPAAIGKRLAIPDAEPVDGNVVLESEISRLSTRSSNTAGRGRKNSDVTIQYQHHVLNAHNIHRANHSASPIAWNSTMYQNAKILAESCSWGHNTSIGGGVYGQNLGAGYSPADVASAVTVSWYNDEMPTFKGQYGKPTPDMSGFEGWGHFTQVVWKDSHSVGCATFDCRPSGGLVDASSGEVLKGLRYYTVCDYWPAGNWVGQFADNVGSPLGKPVVN